MGNILPSPSLDLPIEIDNNINLTEIERRRLEDEDGAVRHNLSYSTTITNSNANNTNHISTNDNVVGPVRLLDSPSFSQGRRQQHGAGIMRQNSNTRTSTSTSSLEGHLSACSYNISRMKLSIFCLVSSVDFVMLPL